jgi:transposase InsO family protein
LNSKLKIGLVGVASTSDVEDDDPEGEPDIGMNTDPGIVDTEAILSMLPFTVEAITITQQNSTVLQELQLCISENIPVKDWPNELGEYVSAVNKLVVDGEGVIWYQGAIAVVVITHELLVDLAVRVHRNMAHIGRDKAVHLLKQHVWHPQLYRVCQDVCITCEHCQIMKVARQCCVPPTLKIRTQFPFELVAVDIVLFPKLRGGWIACCVAIDLNSKWVSAVPVTNKTAETITNVVEHSMFPFLPRLPDRVLSDNGVEFTSGLFRDMLKRYSIKHILSTPYKPTSNGCVERMNRTLGELLRNLDGGPDWWTSLTKALIVYNNTRHRELNMSPARYLLLKAHKIRDSMVLTQADLSVWRAGHPKFASFLVGQHVLKKVQRIGHKTSNKLSPRYAGPYSISKVNENGITYELSDAGADGVKAHHTQLIPWRVQPEYLRQYMSGRLLDEEQTYGDGGNEDFGRDVDMEGRGQHDDSDSDDMMEYSDVVCTESSSEEWSMETDESGDGDSVDDGGSDSVKSGARPDKEYDGGVNSDQYVDCMDESSEQARESSNSVIEQDNGDGDLLLNNLNESWEQTADDEGEEVIGSPVIVQSEADPVATESSMENDELMERVENGAHNVSGSSSDDFAGFEGDTTLTRTRIEKVLTAVREASQVEENNDELVAEDGPQTRSRGRALEIPNVQSVTLEYKHKSWSHDVT